MARIYHTWHGFYPVTGPSPDAFVSIWNTANTSSGSSASNQVKLPLTSAGTYDFTVDWGDGNTDVITAWNQAEVTHTYAASGTYTITCTPSAPGQMKGFAFTNTGDRLKFLDVVQFGGLQLVPTQGQTFYGCANFTGASISDVLDTTGVTSMFRMYEGCASYNGPVNFDTSSVTNMSQMFFLATSFNQPVSFNTSSVTNMSVMFRQATSFNQPVSFNTSSVTNMSQMFRQATNFNSAITFTDTSSVTNMSFMFYLATSFNQPVNFNTSSVTSMNQMFRQATVFNQALNFNTSSVTDMTSMFQQATNFNSAITFTDTSSVTNMGGMFLLATSFNQPVNFNTSSVTNMNFMFQLASSFNQPVNFNTSSVTAMAGMFQQATSFDQDISAFDIDQVANFLNFMASATLSTVNYDALLIAWAAQAPLNPSATSISFGGSKYTSTNPTVVAARNVLVAHFATFADGGPV